MPITNGFSHYQCEVATCGAEVYAISGNASASGYVEAKRIDSTGVERTIVLCGDHAKSYQELARLCDDAIEHLMQTGESSIVSIAEYDKAVSDLAEMTESRDKYWRKYKELQEKYDALAAGGGE